MKVKLKSLALRATAAAAVLSLGLVGAANGNDTNDLLDPPLNPDLPKAFPSAVGYGEVAEGGRGGAVYVVSNLNDSGAGSLRACMESSGPRTCVFSVSGTIELMSPIFVTPAVGGGFLTIAGQTSPGGVQVTQADNPADGRTPFIFQDVTDIIIRHIRVRGNYDPTNPVFVRQSLDGMTFERVDRIALDHVSIAWAADESLNFHQGGTDITIQNSIFAETLRGHAYGPLMCSDQHRDDCGRSTWFGNAFQTNDRRNPQLKTAGTAVGAHDFINNVVSNSGRTGIEIWDDRGGTMANIVGNVGVAGPLNTVSDDQGACVYQTALVNDGNNDADVDNVWYASDNRTIGGLPLYGDNYRCASPTPGPTSAAPVSPLSVTPLPSSQVLDYVTATVGAWPRDTLDQRYAAEIADGDGPAESPLDAGPWPVLVGKRAPVDTDRDGMPNRWEAVNGLHPMNPTDRNGDLDGDGYTNLEEYLEERHREITPQSVGERSRM